METQPAVHLVTYRPTEPDAPAIGNDVNQNSLKSVGSDNTSIASTANMDTEAETESLRKKSKGYNLVPPPEDGERQYDPANDFNIYATKKTIAQGLLDIALLTANITMLKHLLIIGPDNHQFYKPLVVMLWISLGLQVILGLFLLTVGSITKLKSRAQKLNNIVSVIIYAITILNVVISIFNDETITIRYDKCLTDLKESRAHNNQSF